MKISFTNEVTVAPYYKNETRQMLDNFFKMKEQTMVIECDDDIEVRKIRARFQKEKSAHAHPIQIAQRKLTVYIIKEERL